MGRTTTTTLSTDAPEFSRPVSLEALTAGAQTATGEAGEAERAALAARFDLLSLDALRFEATLEPWREGGVLVRGRVQARLAQRCVATLGPAPAEIDEAFLRGFLPAGALPREDHPGAEIEIAFDPEIDDAPEPLTDPLDLGEIAAEAFGLALDPWPRAEGAAFIESAASPPDAEPLREAEVRPFAKLADLKRRMKAEDGG